MSGIDELYVLARRVLLDALEALGTHRDAIVLVGAQAIYLRAGEADLAVAPFTTDADLAIDPAALAEIPPLEQSLMSAGFFPKSSSSVGIWITRRPTSRSAYPEVAVDLLVPASVSPGKGRRAARLRGHDARAARIVKGLDGALVDSDLMRLGSLEKDDPRSFEIRVAGPAALLVAKLHKIAERHQTDRQSDKDALDIYRLLRGVETSELAERFSRLLADPRSATVASEAKELLERQLTTRSGAGIEMAIRSAGPLQDAEVLAASCEALAKDLLAELDAPS
jgi:hypothetical protein